MTSSKNKPSFCSGSCYEIHAKTKWQNKTSLKHSSNTLDTSLECFWNCLQTPINLPWNTLETSLKHPEICLGTSLKLPWPALKHLPDQVKMVNFNRTQAGLHQNFNDAIRHSATALYGDVGRHLTSLRFVYRPQNTDGKSRVWKSNLFVANSDLQAGIWFGSVAPSPIITLPQSPMA